MTHWINNESSSCLVHLAIIARDLGNGIQLPTSMVDSIELILANLTHLPAKRPIAAPSKASSAAKRKSTEPITLDFVVDAIITNGASLAQEEGRWYSRDGGTAWVADRLQLRRLEELWPVACRTAALHLWT